MTDTIICAAIRQPPGFYQDPSSFSVAVNLNFDCRKPEGDPKGRFATFLKALPVATFRVFRLAFEPLPHPQPPTPAPLPYPTWPFAPAAWVASADNTPSRATPVDNIMKWLERRGEPTRGTPAPSDYWLTASALSTTTFKLSDLKATHHLGTAIAWPAPLPQDSGLVRIVTLKPTSNPAQTDHLLVVIPFFDGAPPDFKPTNFKQGDNGVLSFIYNAGTDYPTAVAEIRLIDDPVSTASSLVDAGNGFLVAPVPADAIDADAVAAMLQRIENRSASLLWAFPPIHAVTWPRSDEETIRRLVWRAMSGIAALLDPIVLSLTMPPPPPPPVSDGQKGPFISALIACVDDAWPSSPAPDTSGIAKFVSDGLQAKLRPQESDAGQRSSLVALIASLFKLDMSPDKLTAATATGLIPLLLERYATQRPDQLTKPDWFNDARTRFGSLEVALSNELGALAQMLQADGGIENIVLALFEAIGLFDKTGKSGGALASPPCTKPAIGDAAAKDATAAFSKFLADNFNALDATRHAQAQLYQLHLVAAAAASKARPPGGVAQRWTETDLTTVLKGAHWFARRIDATKQSKFDGIGKVLPVWAAGALTAADSTSLVGAPGPQAGGQLEESFKSVVSDLAATGADRRFVPDHAPQTLKIQVAVDSDPSDIENFAHAYNGIGVLLRRANGNWAYADLADLDIYPIDDAAQKNPKYQGVIDPAHPERKLVTVAPLQPAAIDGQRRLFIDYDGHPFTSQAFSMTSAAGNSSDDNAPFYQYEDPPSELLKADSFVLAPALAYGSTYEAAAFVVSKGGALPLSVQANRLLPWAPANAPQIPAAAAGKYYLRSFQYQRTTAIGRTNLSERPLPGLANRIGVGIDGVQPLFRDHPRVGLSSPNNGSATLDILRNADGTGAFSLPQSGRGTSLSLTNLWWWGLDGASGGTLTLAFFAQPGPRPENAADRTSADDPLLAVNIPIVAADADAAVVIDIESAADAPPTDNVTLTFTVRFAGKQIANPSTRAPASAQSIWIRVKIAAGDPTKTVSLSFADPAAELSGDHVTSRPTPDSLLLIAPTGGSEWRTPYTNAVSGDILLPRVGFNDFDRWLNNDSLAAEAATLVRDQPPTEDDKQRLSTFFATLMAAYILRNTDEGLGPLLERLPDLAVDQLLVELTPLDALYDAPSSVTSYRPSTSIGVISQVVPLRTFGARLPSSGLDDLTNIVSTLEGLSGRCAVGLQIKSDASALSVTSSSDKVKDAALTVVVPRGMVARLTIRPMVPAKYLEGASSIFSSGMASLATEIRDSHYIFEGASIVIESMLGALASDSPGKWQDRIHRDNSNRCYNWESLVAEAVVVRPAGAHRSYDIVVRPEAIAAKPTGWRWRQLANIDIDTQRWRFTGRPIYSWLDPSKQAQRTAVAIEQKWGNGDKSRRDEIVNFETESFFDRDDADADTRTMLLNPADDTVLQSFPWEQPSATYFRHRLTIRSRYEGALKPDQLAAQRAWGDDSDQPSSAARSWIRVAMLADLTQLQLTRPQLRALIPLTRAPELPDDITPAATPPVMAILDERPFAHGGLADRIAAEIRTGLGYVLPPAPEQLQILDARKEFGPDPRLTYTPISAERANAVTLRNEGPVGLTFDSDTVRVPIFANTALVLHPMLMNQEGISVTFEEHFLSVSLRRYLDPAWLMGGTTSSLAISDSLWIQTDDPTFTLGADTATSTSLIKISVENEFWIVQFDPTQIDPSPPPVEGSPSHSLQAGMAPPPPPPADRFKTLCAVHQGQLSALVFLHSPLEKGRASLSVFAVPSGDTGDAAVLAGMGNQPLMMASIEWQIPAGAVNLKAVATFRQPGISLTSASPTTLMNWTRTGKNFAIWHGSDGTTFRPYNVTNAVARRNSNKSSCQFVDPANNKGLTFEPESSRYPNPLYVHRHHAIIAIGHAPGIGRPVETFKDVFRFFGGLLPALDGAQAVRLVEFETPARPLAWLTPLTAFKIAHFDLFSVLDTASALPPGFTLFIRPLGGDTINKTLTELTMNLVLMMRDGSAPTTMAVAIANPKPTLVLRGLLLTVTTVATIKIACSAIYAGGEVDPANVTAPSARVDLKNVLAVELATLSMKTRGAAPSEFWTDVSLLTLPPSGGGNFTFDWFFTGGEAQSPADAITVTAMLSMVEAQARIISISPTIAIEG